MKKIKKKVSRTKFFIGLQVVLSFLLLSSFTSIEKNPNEKDKDVVIENKLVKVSVDEKNGCFSVLEKTSGQLWNSDPWDQAAGTLSVMVNGKSQTVNISKSKSITVSIKSKNVISISFMNPILDDETLEGISIETELRLDPVTAKLDIEVLSYKGGKYKLTDLNYPTRAFSLETDVDRGAAVIPQKQGVICPSYIFPMNGGSFCMWDDATYTAKTIGTLDLFNASGLTMPWWGTYNEKSAVIGIVDEASRPKMFYNLNNNGQYLFNPEGKMSPNKRIVYLDPIWNLKKENQPKIISYQFIPKGNYVDMCKVYRKEAIKRGYFVSLEEKAKRDPDVKKLAGAVYMGVYGAYPHYVEMPGMTFTFKELSEMIKTTHDELKVDNAFFHAWGVFSNFVPNCWPINENLGGVSGLKEAVDLTKKYGYLYSSYHAYSATLENDPKFDTGLFAKNDKGSLKNTGSRWANIDQNKQLGLAQKSLDKEIAALGLEADITDISFSYFADEDNTGYFNLAKYLDSKNLVNGTEHGQQQYIPYFDMFEGMTYLNSNLALFTHRAPLFNLVFHDAIGVFGKIQDPDNQISENGDFAVKSLRNMLFGIGSTIFFSPYEFDGMKVMIKMANEVVSPVNKETFFAELVSHEYLSPDFNLQKSKFSSGTEVIANLGPVKQKTKEGLEIPAFGYQVKYKDGKVSKGSFQISYKN
ncbi:hypothetical protein [Flavobacterium sp. 7A]|uniref:hypothetical protein n=1 Tax=Flavobacterium sp. 7A TaxID=2940571 RepID=UPI00222704D7|nr:hypothetical protein [Flavobacterium sp. 7A]MCW2119021.1 hypothetical protein [Flavobacterium sp. 7A]